MASVNLSRLKHHECAKCGSAILALPSKDMACEQCGCTLFRVRRPTQDEEDYFVAAYIEEEEERERASDGEAVLEAWKREWRRAGKAGLVFLPLAALLGLVIGHHFMFIVLVVLPAVLVLAYCGFFRRPSDWGLLVLAGIVVVVMEACSLGPFGGS